MRYGPGGDPGVRFFFGESDMSDESDGADKSDLSEKGGMR